MGKASARAQRSSAAKSSFGATAHQHAGSQIGEILPSQMEELFEVSEIVILEHDT